MKSLIEFIYNGEVNIYQDNLTEFLRVAGILKIKGLDEVTPNQTTEIADGQDNNDSVLSNATTEVNSLTLQSPNIVKSTKQKDVTVPSTSEQTKSAKKRKSVTFSDTPEIVWGQLDANLVDCQVENNGNGKRKPRPLTDICSITKIKNENEQSVFDSTNEVEKLSKNELFVAINPQSIYTSTESSAIVDCQLIETSTTNQGINTTSRKMIRKKENFLRALKAVRDEGMGFCKAAKIYGVNNRTLWLEYQKLGYPMKNARKKSAT